MKRALLATAALGVVLAGSIIGGALGPTLVKAGNVPLINTATTAVEPANLAAHLNALTQRVNQNIGQLAFLGTPFSTATGTSEQVAASYTLPPTLQSGVGWTGFILHQRCWGTRANNADVVTAKIYFGAQSQSLVITASAATAWDAESWTVINANAVNNTEFKMNNTAVAPAMTNAAGTDSISGGAVVMKCTITDGTSAAADGIVNGWYVEAIH